MLHKLSRAIDLRIVDLRIVDLRIVDLRIVFGRKIVSSNAFFCKPWLPIATRLFSYVIQKWDWKIWLGGSSF
jgi:hypothetical protein